MLDITSDMVATVKGEGAAIAQDAAAYQQLLDIVATASAQEGIRQGLDHVEARAGSASEGVFRGLRSRAWHTSVISSEALKLYRGLKQGVLGLEEQPSRCPRDP
jgi:hypothetical protein